MGDGWGEPNYIAAPLPDGQQQINVLLPDGVPTGLVPVQVEWRGRPMGPEATMRVVPQGPMVPRLLSVADATDLMLGTRISTGAVKVTFEELADPATVTFWVDGRELSSWITHCADPRRPRWELVFRVDDLAAGAHVLQIRTGRRELAPVGLEVVR